MDKPTYKCSRQDLLGVTVPELTRTYKPVSHQQLIELTNDSIEKAGFRLDSEQYSMAREGKIANARYTIKNIADKEMGLEIGWQNSYDKSLSAKFAIGARVFICSNGTVHGELGNFKKKHMGEIQTFVPTAITEYIKRAGDVFNQMVKEREEMKKIELSEQTRAELIGRMFIENDFITSTQLNIIKNNIARPEYDYNSPNTLWELYNFTTQGMRDIHPSLWMQNHMDAHKFFVNSSGILVPKAQIVVPDPGSHPQAELFSNTVSIEEVNTTV